MLGSNEETRRLMKLTEEDIARIRERRQEGIPKFDRKCEEWLEKAKVWHNISFYTKSISTKEIAKGKVSYYLQKAAEERRYPTALISLANLLDRNPIADKNEIIRLLRSVKELVELTEVAEIQENAIANYAMWLMHESDLDIDMRNDVHGGHKHTQHELISYLLLSAERGYAWAQYNMGRLLYSGRTPGRIKLDNNQENMREAVKWYRLSAAQGNSHAQYCLFEIYNHAADEFGCTVEEGIGLIRSSAEQGYTKALYRLGNIYERGGAAFEKNEKEAVRNYHLAATKGCNNSTNRLDVMVRANHCDALFAKGKLLLEDKWLLKKDEENTLQEVIKCFQKAAEQGHEEAKAALVAMQQGAQAVQQGGAQAATPQHQPSEFVFPHNSIILDRASDGGDVVLGRGGFGTVYRGHWHQIRVAVKKLLLRNLDQELRQNFESECRVMFRLRHPNVLMLYGIIVDPEHCMIMEFMAQGSLYDVLHSSRPLSWAMRYQVGLDATQGLVYLHNQRILHRDLKSMNILLDESNKAKLADFGLSRIKASSSQSQELHGAAGTLSWMAPELLINTTARFTEACDIYSLAMVLWELMSRQTPYVNLPNPALVLAHVGLYQNRETVPPEAPGILRTATTESWRQQPERRPTATRLCEILNTQPVTDTTPIPSPHRG